MIFNFLKLSSFYLNFRSTRTVSPNLARAYALLFCQFFIYSVFYKLLIFLSFLFLFCLGLYIKKSKKLEVGAHLCITVSPPGIKSMEFKPEVFAVRPGEEIIWGRSFLLFVYRGDHLMSLEPFPGGKTRFRQRERFQGPLVLFMGKMFEPTEQGYYQMNKALKEHVESNFRS